MIHSSTKIIDTFFLKKNNQMWRYSIAEKNPLDVISRKKKKKKETPLDVLSTRTCIYHQINTSILGWEYNKDSNSKYEFIV